MTAERSTLLQAVHGATGRAPRWDRLIMLHNVAPVPTLTSAQADTLHGRGFHVVATDRLGRVTHHFKCRPTGDSRAVREANLLEQLTGTSAASCVPRTRVFRGSVLQVVALDTVAGERLDDRLRRRNADRAPEDAAEVLRTLGRIRAAAGPPPQPRQLDAGLALDDALRTLEHHGLAADTVTRLRALPAGVWPWIPQHGDLWPNNVIWSANGPVILDFEAYGEVGHPMFDAWQLLRTSHGSIGAQSTWLGVLSPQTRFQRRWHHLVQEAQLAARAPMEDVRAGLVWYASHMAATLLNRGVPPHFSRPYIEDVQRVAALLG